MPFLFQVIFLLLCHMYSITFLSPITFPLRPFFLSHGSFLVLWPIPYIWERICGICLFQPALSQLIEPYSDPLVPKLFHVVMWWMDVFSKVKTTNLNDQVSLRISSHPWKLSSQFLEFGPAVSIDHPTCQLTQRKILVYPRLVKMTLKFWKSTGKMQKVSF